MLHDLEAGNRLEAPWLCGASRSLHRTRDRGAGQRHVYAALKPYMNGSPL